jgi:hypothetical protein
MFASTLNHGRKNTRQSWSSRTIIAGTFTVYSQRELIAKRHRKALDIAIQKLEYQRAQHQKERRERAITLWERMVKRLLDSQGPNEQDIMALIGETPTEPQTAPGSPTRPRSNPHNRASSSGRHNLKSQQSSPATDTGLQFSIGNQFQQMFSPVTIEKMEQALWSVFRRIVRRHHPNLRLVVLESRRRLPKPIYITDIVQEEPKAPSYHLRLKRSRSTIDLVAIERHLNEMPEGLVRSNSESAINLNPVTRGLNPEEKKRIDAELYPPEGDKEDGMSMADASDNDASSGGEAGVKVFLNPFLIFVGVVGRRE